MSTEPNNQRDVIIIGGGPAGLSASLWCTDLGMRAVLFEKEEELGGQLLRIFGPIGNYVGRYAENGRELQAHFLSSLDENGLLERNHAEVAEIEVTGRSVILNNGERLSAKAIIVATGVRRRKLGVEGEDLFSGKGIIESGAKEKNELAGKRVLIVGGGDAALENALVLAEYAGEIHVAHRRAEFKARPEFLERAKLDPKIRFHFKTAVRKFDGDENLSKVVLEDTESGRTFELSADNALIRIGVEPNTELLAGKLELDERGYFKVDGKCETSKPGIFAAGDAANPISPTISTAAGTGATAAKAIYACIYGRKAVL